MGLWVTLGILYERLVRRGCEEAARNGELDGFGNGSRPGPGNDLPAAAVLMQDERIAAGLAFGDALEFVAVDGGEDEIGVGGVGVVDEEPAHGEFGVRDARHELEAQAKREGARGLKAVFPAKGTSHLPATTK